jgi:uncharacterized protein (DUF433 family)
VISGVGAACHNVAVADTSLLDLAIYSFADVDRLVGLPPGTARRWIDGYRRVGVDYPPVLRPEHTGSEDVTWGEMVEARLLAEFRGQRVSLQRLRPAVQRLRDELGAYPLAHARPFLEVEGRELVRRVQDEVGLVRQLQLVVVRSGQTMLDVRAERFTAAAEYEHGAVVALHPQARTPAVRMDPRHAFGQPAIRSVRTDVLAEEYRAGVGRDELAGLYDLTTNQVDEALRFEMIAAAESAA